MKPRRKVDRAVKKTIANPWLKRLIRVGYVLRGCLYGAVGVLAIRSAMGWQGQTEDLRGSLVLLPAGPVRVLVLPVLVMGLFAYGVWGFVRAIYDPLNRGNDSKGIAARLGFIWSGMNYVLLSVFSVVFLVGASNSDGSDAIYRTVNSVMSYPAGWFALMVAGGIGTISGLAQFVDAYRAPFRRDLKRGQMSRAERNVTDTLGRIGMVARGVVFTMLGWFILQAGISRDPNRAKNLRQVLSAVADLPFGHFLLATVGLGLITLCLHSWACARWARMPQTAASAKPT